VDSRWQQNDRQQCIYERWGSVCVCVPLCVRVSVCLCNCVYVYVCVYDAIKTGSICRNRMGGEYESTDFKNMCSLGWFRNLIIFTQNY